MFNDLHTYVLMKPRRAIVCITSARALSSFKNSLRMVLLCDDHSSLSWGLLFGILTKIFVTSAVIYTAHMRLNASHGYYQKIARLLGKQDCSKNITDCTLVVIMEGCLGFGHDVCGDS
jgi:hypothetical protein